MHLHDRGGLRAGAGAESSARCHFVMKIQKIKSVIKRVGLRGKKGCRVMNRNKVFDLCGSRVRTPLFWMAFFLFCFLVGRAACLAQKTRKHQQRNVTLKAASPCCVSVDKEEGGREGRALIG